MKQIKKIKSRNNQCDSIPSNETKFDRLLKKSDQKIAKKKDIRTDKKLDKLFKRERKYLSNMEEGKEELFEAYAETSEESDWRKNKKKQLHKRGISDDEYYSDNNDNQYSSDKDQEEWKELWEELKETGDLLVKRIKRNMQNVYYHFAFKNDHNFKMFLVGICIKALTASALVIVYFVKLWLIPKMLKGSGASSTSDFTSKVHYDQS